MYICVCVCVYMYIYICFSMFSLHLQSSMHLKLAIGLCLYLCLFSFVLLNIIFYLLATGECLEWDLGSRSYSCRWGSTYPNKVKVKLNMHLIVIR